MRAFMLLMFLIGWVVAAAALLGFAVWVRKRLNLDFGIFIDTRGRYSLSQFQVVLWTVLVLSLYSVLFVARLIVGAENPLLSIPNELLTVMGISIGGTAGAIAIKSAHDAANQNGVAATGVMEDPQNPGYALKINGAKEEYRARWMQMLLVEEGDFADKIIDVTKYQNFLITILLLVAYVALVIKAVNSVAILQVQLPTFDDTFLVLLGISHAGYLAAKLPTRPGTAEYSLLNRRRARTLK